MDRVENISETTPQWQPITQLSLIARVIDGMLESAQEQYRIVLQARPRPRVLDASTLGRMIAALRAHQDDLEIFDDQLRCWHCLPLALVQRQEIERLTGQLSQLRQVIITTLAVAGELKERPIEKLSTKSESELLRL